MAHTVNDLSARSREVFRMIIDSYVEGGGPVGSRSISRQLVRETRKEGGGLSPATIRNIMSDLEDLGLITSPHTSAGRVPTDLGLRFFVDGLMEVGDFEDPVPDVGQMIEHDCAVNMTRLLENASGMVADLSQCAAIVAAPQGEAEIGHIEFVMLSPGRGLVILVSKSGLVENRLIDLPPGIPPSHLTQATNYLNHILGRTQIEGMCVEEIIKSIRTDMDTRQRELDALTRRIVDEGLAVWSDDAESGKLIVNGRANLVSDDGQDLEQVRHLLSVLEDRKTMLKLLDATRNSDGVQIYIGSENPLFESSGCSLIVGPIIRTSSQAPSQASETGAANRLIGAIGVIGPTRVNYAHVIPLVDSTSRLVSRLINSD